MKNLIILLTLTLSLISCENLQTIELEAIQALEDNKILKATCDMSYSSYTPPSPLSLTNISFESFLSGRITSSSTDMINGAVSKDGVVGKCMVRTTSVVCPMCRLTAPVYTVEYATLKGTSASSDSCLLNDGNTVSINLSDKENPSCTVSIIRQISVPLAIR